MRDVERARILILGSGVLGGDVLASDLLYVEIPVSK
jgi:hypothetical protein